MAKFDPYAYKVPGETVFDDVVYTAMFYGPTSRDSVKKYKGSPQDIMLAAYPKTGITWTTAMLTQLLNDGDIKKADSQGNVLFGRLDYIERHPEGAEPFADTLAKMPPPRVFKTHLRYRYLKHVVEKDKVKTIILLRNPKDTLVSFYHFYKMCVIFGKFTGTFSEYFELLKANRMAFGDIFEWYRDWWQARHLPNVLVMKYEDMIGDPLGTAKTMSEFIGKNLSDATLKNVAEACSFKKMTENPATQMDKIPYFDQSISKFYRKGKVGDWVNHFNDEQSAYVDAKCKEYFDPVGLKFDYE